MDASIEYSTITRKYTLNPCKCDTKEWIKKCYDYTIDDLNRSIKNTKNKLKKKDLSEKDIKDAKEKLEKDETTLADLTLKRLDYPFTSQMIRKYTKYLIREAMASEAERKNYILSYAFSTMIENGLQYMKDPKERNKFITGMLKPAYRIKGSKKGSLFDDTEIQSILKGYGNDFSQELTNKIKDAVKKGLLEGKVALPTYKLNSPFSIGKDRMSFSHDYESYDEMLYHINEPGFKLYFNYGSQGKPTIAKFTIELGHKKNRKELMATLMKVYSGEYPYCGSKIVINKDGKIILLLSMKVPKKQHELDENTVVGVDIGIAVPAVCALNNNYYPREYLGSKDDFLQIRTQFQRQRRNLNSSLKVAKGGHGSDRRLKAMRRLKDREKNFVQTYNHKISREVINFALKHNAKYINIENLKNYKSDQFILRNWSYYQLQQDIIYKAEMHGIIVRKIDPKYTSQKCSCCGYIDKNNRPKEEKGQAYFKCLKCGKELNADYNAARNIAMSEEFKV
jgi:IS605 OrfB family transposase